MGQLRAIIFGAAVAAMAFPAHAWTVRRTVDPISDATTIDAQQPSTDGGAILHVSCEEGVVYLWVRTGRFFTSGNVSVRYRFDRDPGHTELWAGYDDGRGASIGLGPLTAQDLATKSTLLLELTDYLGGARLYRFSLAGSRAAITQPAEACGFTLISPDMAAAGVLPIVTENLDRAGPVQRQFIGKELRLVGMADAPIDGKQSVALYAAMSRWYADFAPRCVAGTTGVPLCDSWAKAHPGAQISDLPWSPVALLDMASGAITAAREAEQSGP